MKGAIHTGGIDTRVHSLTMVRSKQLRSAYDKSMIDDNICGILKQAYESTHSHILIFETGRQEQTTTQIRS